MTTRLKIILTMLAMIGFAAASSIIAVLLNQKQESIITDHNLEQHQQTCEAVVEIMNSKVSQIVYDYTFWDDYVTFIHKPDKTWGEENISSILSSFNMNGVWMINLEGKVIYSDFTEGFEELSQITFDSSLLSQLYNDRFICYYSFSPVGLVHIDGATIHPTSDRDRITPPNGYFFLLKVWDDDLLETVNKLTGSKVTVSENCQSSLKVSSGNEIYYANPINNWKKEAIGSFVFCKKLYFMELYGSTSTQLIALFIVTAIAILFILTFLLSRWVSTPLKLVADMIATENIEKLEELKSKSLEFKRIGRLINAFINQKKKLKVAKQRAEESDNLKSAFLANMSHEIRTPLFGVLGFTELLKDKNLSEEVKANYIEVILNSGNHLLSLINDIIDLSKIESGVFTLHTEAVNVDEMLTDLYEFFIDNKYIRERNLELKLANELREESVIIETDRKRLKQVLTNLIGNAIKFTLQGEVEFGYKQIGEKEILFFVRDTGIGIAEDQHKKVFDRFIQVDNRETSRQFEGTGLGLAISKALVEQAGGKMWLESELNCGSLFSFTLPALIRITSETSRLFVSGITSLNQKSDLKGKKVLVVDDVDQNIFLFKTILNKVGCTVLEAKNAEKAIEIILNAANLDLILLDIRLPEKDGHTLAHEIRNMGIKTLIVAHSAYAIDGYRKKALEAGCNEFFAKPIGEQELISMLSELINS
jgi:signal transduction histidine kinase/CheY-like chemotaxis protein